MPVDFSKVENTVFTRIEEDHIIQALENMLDIVGEDYRLTPQERITLNGINHANKGFVQDALEAVRAYDNMLPGYIDAAALETTWRYYLQLERFVLLLDRLSEVVRDRKQTAGAILFRDARTVYGVLKAGDRHAIGGLEALLKRMKARFMGQVLGGRNAAESTNSEAEATVVAFTPEVDPGEAEGGVTPPIAA